MNDVGAPAMASTMKNLDELAPQVVINVPTPLQQQETEETAVSNAAAGEGQPAAIQDSASPSLRQAPPYRGLV